MLSSGQNQLAFENGGNLKQGDARFSQVLITRPQADAEHLAALLAAMGIDSIIQPAQEFIARPLTAQELETLQALQPPTLLIFTSTRAVEFGLQQLPGALFSSSRIAAIGPATARALLAAGRRVDIRPEDGYTSEALLASPAVESGSGGGHALVVGAPGGREVLVDTLGDRGWKARQVWVYERRAAGLRPEALQGIEEAGRLLTVFTSGEAMKSLSQRLPPAAWYVICRGEWLVISERLRRLARAYGPSGIHVANGPQNEDLAAAVGSIRVCR